MHADDDRLRGAHDDDALRALALLLAAALQVRDAAVVVVHLAARERVLLPGDVEAGRGDRRQILPLQERRQLLRLVDLHLVQVGRGPLRAVVPVDRRVLRSSR